jgi:hypothetical protein
MLARQELYCLNHTASPFYFGYFGDRVLLCAQAGPVHDSCILYFLLYLGQAFFLVRWSLTNFSAQADFQLLLIL